MDGFLAGIFLLALGSFLIFKADLVQMFLSWHVTIINRMFRMAKPKPEKTNTIYIKAFGIVWLGIGILILYMEV